MERHVTLLTLLVTLWGSLVVLAGVSLLLLAAGALVQWIDPVSPALRFAAGLTAGMFVTVGGFAVLWGGAHVWAATLVKRRQALGRVVVLALALTNLVVLPFGTALGIYALWVLLTNEGRRLFETPATAAASK